MILAYIVIGFLLFFVVCHHFDALLRYQHENHHEAWVDDGRPRGFGFRPAGSSSISMSLFMFRGFKEAPSWVLSDESALIKYSRVAQIQRVWKWYSFMIFPVVFIASIT